MLSLPQTRTAVLRRGSLGAFLRPLQVSEPERTRSDRSIRSASGSATNVPKQIANAKATDTSRIQHPPNDGNPVSSAQNTKKKTLQEMDEELRLKMEGLAGDGGASGVEYENGKPVAMKRSVKENLFRYI
ncbi:hypothetical protein B0J18DRAFT_63158 [Chaetomium sp. MPI-SDFR-AT-0129]|nr:hypothetical protein B0J18DRAFT_63158 [Chaetomium sp. MPI-SDFR-AT-0129]